MSQIRLGDLLLRAGVVSDTQVNAALNEQKKWGGRLGTILVRMGALSEDLLVKALARQLNIPRAALGPTDEIHVPRQILDRIDRAFCERHLVIPYGFLPERRALQIATADPFNVVVVDDLGKKLGLRIEPLIAGESQVMHAISRLYGGTAVDTIRSDDGGGMQFVDNSGAALGSRRPTRASLPATSTSTSNAMMPAPPSTSQPPGFLPPTPQTWSGMTLPSQPAFVPPGAQPWTGATSPGIPAFVPPGAQPWTGATSPGIPAFVPPGAQPWTGATSPGIPAFAPPGPQPWAGATSPGIVPFGPGTTSPGITPFGPGATAAWNAPSSPAVPAFSPPPNVIPDELRSVAEQQQKAVRALIELLVEKGVLAATALSGRPGR